MADWREEAKELERLYSEMNSDTKKNTDTKSDTNINNSVSVDVGSAPVGDPFASFTPYTDSDGKYHTVITTADGRKVGGYIQNGATYYDNGYRIQEGDSVVGINGETYTKGKAEWNPATSILGEKYWEIMDADDGMVGGTKRADSVRNNLMQTKEGYDTDQYGQNVRNGNYTIHADGHVSVYDGFQNYMGSFDSAGNWHPNTSDGWMSDENRAEDTEFKNTWRDSALYALGQTGYVFKGNGDEWVDPKNLAYDPSYMKPGDGYGPWTKRGTTYDNWTDQARAYNTDAYGEYAGEWNYISGDDIKNGNSKLKQGVNVIEGLGNPYAGADDANYRYFLERGRYPEKDLTDTGKGISNPSFPNSPTSPYGGYTDTGDMYSWLQDAYRQTTVPTAPNRTAPEAPALKAYGGGTYTYNPGEKFNQTTSDLNSMLKKSSINYNGGQLQSYNPSQSTSKQIVNDLLQSTQVNHANQAESMYSSVNDERREK